MTSPLVSIGMPVYNGAKYLRSSIQSLLDQTFEDFELLLSDNASTDGTRDICLEYARLDSRVQYSCHEQNIGGPRNWNHVARRASGRFFKWASANDLYDRHFIEKCVLVLESDRDVVLCYSDTLLIDGCGEIIEAYEDPLDVTSSNPVERYKHLLKTILLNNAQAGVVRTDALREMSLERIYPASDVPLMAELCLHGKFIRLAEPLFFRRIAEGAATTMATTEELSRFIDPQAGKGVCWRLWPLYIDHMRRLVRAPISHRTRVQAAAFVLRMMSWRRAELSAEIFAFFRRRQSF